ncbi:MarR family winged helix-turn-helix transcriptional regulator [Solimonas marina]|uniref:MarR family transcriptional regulator n=1 Tax=Solimonas marina TaxID=2714601 RepID=A0A970B7U2_9GAMM|nr:MarR family transcriptional regulator [Solimonas marina]NKF24263.1 MarR family transcriptional regulator [Solimonas marina]
MRTPDTNLKRNIPEPKIVDGLVQLSTLVQAVLARAADSFDLSVLQGRLLGVLRDREPTMAQLRLLLNLDKSSTTGLIDRAERRGLVCRSPVLEDGRSFRVTLTNEGRKLAAALVAKVSAQVGELTDDLSDTNRHRLSLLADAIVQRHAAAHGIDLSTTITPPDAVHGQRPQKGKHQ